MKARSASPENSFPIPYSAFDILGSCPRLSVTPGRAAGKLILDVVVGDVVFVGVAIIGVRRTGLSSIRITLTRSG